MSKSCLKVGRANLLVFVAPVFILIFSISVAATPESYGIKDNFQYDFNWGFVPVASLEIDFTAYNSEGVVKSIGKTKGLSKIFKSYSARALVKRIDESTQLYELFGSDRGVEETRKIRFRSGKLPKVLALP